MIRSFIYIIIVACFIWVPIGAAVEPAYIPVSDVSANPGSPAVGQIFTCTITTDYSNPDKMACGLVVAGAPDDTKAIDICAKTDMTGYLGYSGGQRVYRCTTNTLTTNTVSPGEFDLVAVSFDCDGNCSRIMRRRRISILGQVPATPTLPATNTPQPPTMTPIPPTAVPRLDTPTPTISSSTEPQVTPTILPTETPVTSPRAYIYQQEYIPPVQTADAVQTQTTYRYESFQSDTRITPTTQSPVFADLTLRVHTFMKDTFSPFASRSDIKPIQSAKELLWGFYTNFMTEAGF